MKWIGWLGALAMAIPVFNSLEWHGYNFIGRMLIYSGIVVIGLFLRMTEDK